MKKPVRHRHRFTYASYGPGAILRFRCACGDFTERPATPAERRFCQKHVVDFSKPMLIHAAWHDFVKKMKRFVKTGETKLGGKVFACGRDEYRWRGYDLMERVAEWAKKWPDDVRITGCDDSYHTSSDLVLIEHKSPDAYMGTTVIVITQNDGQPPAEFFLYPDDANGLIDTLKAIRTVAKRIEKRETILLAERSRLIRNNLKWKANKC